LLFGWVAEGDVAVSTDANKLLVRRYLEEVVNTGDVSRIADFVSPDYIDTHDTSGQSSGLDGVRRHVLGVRATYPDLHVTVEQQLAEADWVVTRITARGTHRGEWLGMRPTGKAVEFTGVNIDRVVDGRIVEHGGAANLLGPLLAIGAVRVVGPGDG
jgi:predicted ester cyclase